MPIPPRADFDAAGVRDAARESKDAGQVRGLLAPAAIYDGATGTRAAEIGGVSQQILRGRAIKFNARGPQGLIARAAPGQRDRGASHCPEGPRHHGRLLVVAELEPQIAAAWSAVAALFPRTFFRFARHAAALESASPFSLR